MKECSRKLYTVLHQYHMNISIKDIHSCSETGNHCILNKYKQKKMNKIKYKQKWINGEKEMIVLKYKNTNRENFKTVLPIWINSP